MGAVAGFGFFRKFYLWLSILGIITLLGVMIMNITSSVAYGIQENDWKPFLGETAGTFLSTDFKLKLAVQNLLDENLEKEYRDYWKGLVFKSLVLQIAMIVGAFWLIRAIAGRYQLHFSLQLILFLFVILAIIGFSFAYLLVMDVPITKTNMPFSGIYELVKYRKQVWDVGKLSLFTTNELPENMNNTNTNLDINNTGVDQMIGDLPPVESFLL